MASIRLGADTARSRRWRVLETVAYGLAPAVVVATILGIWLHALGDGLGFDMRHAFLPAARDVLDGVSPYPEPGDPEIAQQHAYVYSPVLAYALVPLTVMPDSVAVLVCAFASFAVALSILALIGVRDWRCYGVIVMWPPVINSADTVNVSLPIAALVALAWKWREREFASGAVIGCAVAVKSFAWPLLVWHALVGRLRGSATSVVVAVGLAFATWALLGFAGLRDYPELLRTVTALEERESYSFSGALLELGAGEAIARGAMVAVTAGLLAVAALFGRRRDERRAFVALVMAALASTPILWQHYLTFLLVALAVTLPRLSFVWFLPLALYVAPVVDNGRLWTTLLVPVVTAIVGIACLVPGTSVVGRVGRYSSSPKSGVSTRPSA